MHLGNKILVFQPYKVRNLNTVDGQTEQKNLLLFVIVIVDQRLRKCLKTRNNFRRHLNLHSKIIQSYLENHKPQLITMKAQLKLQSNDQFLIINGWDKHLNRINNLLAMLKVHHHQQQRKLRMINLNYPVLISLNQMIH